MEKPHKRLEVWKQSMELVAPCVRIDVASNNLNRERRKGDRWESIQRNSKQR